MKNKKEIMIGNAKILTEKGIKKLNDDEYVCSEYGVKIINNNIIECHDINYIIEKILEQKKYDKLIE